MKRNTHRRANALTAVLCGVACLGVWSCAEGRQSQKEVSIPGCSSTVCRVSVSQVASNPAAYAGKQIVVIGVLKLAFEEEAVYASEWHARVGDTASGLWIDVSGVKEAEALNGKSVFVSGTVDVSMNGHMGLYPAGIRSVKILREWPPLEKDSK
jgi:hypothetical protein